MPPARPSSGLVAAIEHLGDLIDPLGPRPVAARNAQIAVQAYELYEPRGNPSTSLR